MLKREIPRMKVLLSIVLSTLGGGLLAFISIIVFEFKVTIYLPPFDSIRGEWLIFYFMVLGLISRYE